MSSRSSRTDPFRLAAVYATGLLDAPPEKAFDRLTGLVTQLLDVPISLVSLVDIDRQFFVSCPGVAEPWASARETPLSHSFCQYVVESGHALVIEDARVHPLVCDNPAIADLGVIAYAGMPLQTAAGHVLGSFCAVDTAPRRWTERELEILRELAASAVTELELRLTTRALEDQERELATLLDRTSEMVCAADLAGRITYVNRAWCDALGYTPEEATAVRPIDLVVPEHRKRFLDAAQQMQRGEIVTDFEAVLVGKGGRRVVCRGSGAPRYAGGELVGTYAVYRDMTKERNAEEGRARLVTTIEASPDFVAIVGMDGTVAYMNRAGRRLIGLSEADFPSTIAELWPEREAIRMRETVFLAALRDTVWQGDSVLLGANGEEIPVLQTVIVHPSTRADGSLYYLSIVARDLRERVRTERALRESEDRFRSMLENVRTLTVALDVHGNVLFVNDALLELTGWSRDEIIGTSWFERFTRTGEELRPRFDAIIASGAIHPHGEGMILTRTGEERLISWDNTLLRDADGRISGTASIGQDVTAQRQVAKLKDELIALVSHELRTPLGAIRSALRLVTPYAAQWEGRSRQLFDMAVRNADQLFRMVNDLLDIERAESGTVVLDRQRVPAETLLQRARDIVQALSETTGVNVVVAPSEAQVWANPDRVVQILTNLLGNALKFSPGGSIVSLSATVETPGEVRFSVRDEGRGIPPEKLDRIFGRFEQVEAGDATHHGGTGLGLAIARALTQQHGGRIWVESEVGRGSAFYFTIPEAP